MHESLSHPGQFCLLLQPGECWGDEVELRLAGVGLEGGAGGSKGWGEVDGLITRVAFLQVD